MELLGAGSAGMSREATIESMASAPTKPARKLPFHTTNVLSRMMNEAGLRAIHGELGSEGFKRAIMALIANSQKGFKEAVLPSKASKAEMVERIMGKKLK